MVDPAVEQDEIENILDQFSLLKNFDRRDSDSFSIDGVGIRRIGAGHPPAHIVVVSNIGHIGHHLALIKNRGGHGDIRQVGAASVVGIVGDKHVSGMNLIGSKVLFDCAD